MLWLARAHRALLRAWDRSPAIRWLNRRIESAHAQACRRCEVVPALPIAYTAPRAHGDYLVLKAPRLAAGNVVERGVLIVKYSHRIEALPRLLNLEALLRQYTLVLEPSWTGYASAYLLAYTRYRDPIVVFSPFRGDQQFLTALGSNLIPIALSPGDWVDPSTFYPLPGEPKRFDAVMIARWSHFKRHDLMLRAIRRIADPRFRVAIVALNRSQYVDRDAHLALIAAHGLQDQVEIFEDLPPAEVNRVLNQSKVNVLLSQQEGGNRGLFEGFFAGVPGLAPRNHIGIPLEHLRPETGRLMNVRDLASELLYFRDHWSEFDPRPWALANIAPEVSARRLNDLLKQQATARREPWTKDIVAKCNRPSLAYYPEEAGRSLPSFADLVQEFAPLTSARTNHPRTPPPSR